VLKVESKKVGSVVDREPMRGDCVKAYVRKWRFRGQLVEDRREVIRYNEDKVHRIASAITAGRALDKSVEPLCRLTEESAEVRGGGGTRPAVEMIRNIPSREADERLSDTKAEDICSVSKHEYCAGARLVLAFLPEVR